MEVSTGRWSDGLRQQEKIPQAAQRFAARGMPQAVIADLVEAGRQDVREEAPDELVAGHGFLTLAVGGAVFVAIGRYDRIRKVNFSSMRWPAPPRSTPCLAHTEPAHP